ncbi:hypothetical protein ScoT_51150 [Streptomyces albidoflavus]|uniref:Uncharacterized protein n=1 Tax=Streptomyces albidoflavus TaxID=1886 RepID=A0AA37C1X4_9ACTN|nr:hypothetical protein ScoT_51150 [Streptomyces albidoflavus]
MTATDKAPAHRGEAQQRGPAGATPNSPRRHNRGPQANKRTPYRTGGARAAMALLGT